VCSCATVITADYVRDVILVIGATGRTGQIVVDHLLRDGRDVRILTRASSIVPDRLRGIERVTGDLEDPESLRRAMSGVEAVFVLSPMDPSLDRLEANAFDAAMRAEVGHIVKMSTTKPEPESLIPWWRAHWRAERQLRSTYVPWTILRPNGISFFLLGHSASVRDQGVFRTAAGDGRMALIDADDIGAVTARVFGDRERYACAVLDLTGPEAVSYGDIADILTTVTGRAVRHVRVSADEARTALLDAGVADWEAEGIVANWLMTRDGSGEFDRVTDVVERITGHRPRAVAQFLAAHRDAFTPAA
jgi:uncharacterized protein YbjT (DUF2867 family)